MRSFASRLLRPASPLPQPNKREWTIPEGRRVYVVGDVHGRLDLLERLFAQIEQDDAGRPAARRTLVLLGDLVDRGPDSRGVIEFLMARAAAGEDCLFLGGNHDELFVRAAQGERDAAARLHRMGGRETALSYGITAEEYGYGTFDDLAELLLRRVPREHVAFLRSFKDWSRIGDYVFVHAGIRPGKPMAEQSPGDLRWIRNDFLDFVPCHGMMVVHGHTVTEEPDLRANRIGIDTGAFRSGKLTALGLEGADRWIFST